MDKLLHLPLIAIDLGGVVEDTWRAKQVWLSQHNFKVDSPLDRKALRGLLGRELHDAMLHEVYSDEAMDLRSPTPGLLEALAELNNWANIVILTTRNPAKKLVVEKWLEKQGLLSFLHQLVMLNDESFLPPNSLICSKLEWCTAHACNFLIDDDMRHISPLEHYPDIFRIRYQLGTSTIHQPAQNLAVGGSWPQILNQLKYQIEQKYTISESLDPLYQSKL